MTIKWCKAALGSVLGAMLLLPLTALADWELNMPVGVTQISREVYDLHMLIFYVCCVIAVIVFGAMFYSVFMHRKSRGVEASQFHHSTAAEIIWTIIPFVILVAMAIPAAGTLIMMEDTSNADMTIKVTGYQWKWQYTYLDEGIDFMSALHPDSDRARRTGSGIDPNSVPNYLLEVDNPLVVPVNKKVRILLTANDVIHAWWVPAIGTKKDAVPGYINELWFNIDTPGVYRGQCAELCGRDHGFMPVVIRAVEQAEYEAWVAAQGGTTQVADAQVAAATDAVADAPAAPAEEAAPAGLTREALMARGEAEYNKYCSACHKADGAGMPPAFPPLTGSPVTLGDINVHIDMVLKGKKGTAMAAFGSQLDDEQVAAIVTYERNALGNSVGDQAQAADVAARR